MKQKPPSMFFMKIDGDAVSEHDGSLSSAENKLVTQRRGREFERRKPFVVEMGALARPSDIQRSFLSRAVRMARQIQKTGSPRCGKPVFGAAGQIRTADLVITNDALYRLSYSSMAVSNSFIIIA